MLFRYTVINQSGVQSTGEIDASTQELAVDSLQKRGFIVVSVVETKGANGDLLSGIAFFNRISLKSIVIMSRQIASLFDAQIAAVKAFNLMAESTKSTALKTVLESVSQDIQGGITIADAMEKHPNAFSSFYVNMVRAGEESGRLTETFNYLADYLERQYELTSKTKNALIYPAFVVLTFFTVITLMMTMVIPKLTQIILESGQEIPIYTKIVIWMSDTLVNYGFIILIALILGVIAVGYQLRTPAGKRMLDNTKLSIPYLGSMYSKVYLARIADNLSTMLSAGIPVIHTLEITASVVGNKVFEDIINETIQSVRGGANISDTFSLHPEMPNVLTQMIKVGEESGELSNVLKKLASFYKKEVENAVDSMIGLIEPAMIIALGLSVGFLLMSVLVPIYNLGNSIG